MFIFQSSLNEIQVQQLRMNCPYPLLNKNVTDIEIRDTNVFYNATELNAQSNSYVTVFRCGENNQMQVTESFYTYASGIFDAQQAFIGYLSASITAFFDKIVALANMVYLLINAPAVVTGLAWFSYITIVLFAFMAIGAFMVIRG
jgi:hypothetical protein